LTSFQYRGGSKKAKKSRAEGGEESFKQEFASAKEEEIESKKT